MRCERKTHTKMAYLNATKSESRRANSSRRRQAALEASARELGVPFFLLRLFRGGAKKLLITNPRIRYRND